MIVSQLTKAFCEKKGQKYLNYVLDVLLPECLIRIVMRHMAVSYTEAEDVLTEN